MTGDELRKLLDPTIERLGYELSDLEAKLGGKDGVVRIFIDHPDGIALEDCEKVSRAVSAILDVEEPLPGQYSLEVSSPGLDRRLVKPEHFRRFVGRKAQVRTLSPTDGRRKFRGELVAADEEGIRIDIDGQACELEYGQIESARLVPDL